MKTFYATVIDINFVLMALALYRSFPPFLGGRAGVMLRTIRGRMG